jgi:hypothetical protein
VTINIRDREKRHDEYNSILIRTEINVPEIHKLKLCNTKKYPGVEMS